MNRVLYPGKGNQTEGLKGPGLIHVCYGQGVGKTSRCVGLAVRAAGAGFKVHWVQFMKSDDSSETAIFTRLPEVTYQCPGEHPFITAKGAGPKHFEHARQAMDMALAAAEQGCQILICDEILNTILFGLLPVEEIVELMDLCRSKVELVLSGADAPVEVLEKADYVTEFVMRKHPYNMGQSARKGIEF